MKWLSPELEPVISEIGNPVCPVNANADPLEVVTVNFGVANVKRLGDVNCDASKTLPCP